MNGPENFVTDSNLQEIKSAIEQVHGKIGLSVYIHALQTIALILNSQSIHERIRGIQELADKHAGINPRVVGLLREELDRVDGDTVDVTRQFINQFHMDFLNEEDYDVIRVKYYLYGLDGKGPQTVTFGTGKRRGKELELDLSEWLTSPIELV